MSIDAVCTVLDDTRAALIERAGLTGVNVYTADVSIDDRGNEYILFFDPTLEMLRGGAAGYRLESWKVDGEIRAWSTWAGTIEDTIKAARDRVVGFLQELDSHLTAAYQNIPSVTITTGGFSQNHQSQDRACLLPFEMLIETVGESEDDAESVG